jgi:hypothetical protein
MSRRLGPAQALALKFLRSRGAGGSRLFSFQPTHSDAGEASQLLLVARASRPWKNMARMAMPPTAHF